MTKLIVALDFDSALEARGLFNRFQGETNAERLWFKIGPRMLMSNGAQELCERIADVSNLFLDLKVYDTRDTVHAVARRAFTLGARMLTVHATPSMLEAAVRVKPAGDRYKVLAAGQLTDANTSLELTVRTAESVVMAGANGIICSTDLVAAVKQSYAGITTVCPGIRLVGSAKDNHMWTCTPRAAAERRADYIVVGRPIYDASDPVDAARKILAELGEPR